ncbi:MAG: Zn-dependent oligopeptidase [Burkholderiaceae bacterium]|jgi:thimet oligopeptidase|nr:Zn-dependent oligopeptidase [Burkholderiaceae bacterium]
MKISRFLGTGVVLLSVWLPVQVLARHDALPLLGAEEIADTCSRAVTQWKASIAELEAVPARTPEGSVRFIKGWNRLQVAVEDVQGVVYLLANVSPDEAVRTAAETCDAEIRKFGAALFQNGKLYRNMRFLRVRDNVEKKFRRDALDSFEDGGVSIMPQKQVRMREIRERLTVLQQTFSRHIRDNPARMVFSPEQMAGLPQSTLSAAKRDEQGNYVLDFSYPLYIPFMQYAHDGEARKQYQHAFLNRGTPENVALLQEAATLRHELAELLGYRSYADYVLHRRMAKKPARVSAFLNEIENAIRGAEKEELEELRHFRAREEGTPYDSTALARWDVAYWQEKLKQSRFRIDQNDMRRYFPTSAAVPWVMGLASSLYGIDFVPGKVPRWHEDVQFFAVIDKETKQSIGGIYLDIFPREGKYGHAAAFQARGSSTQENRKPISVLVANFNRAGLDMRELETLLHEFGHVLHGVLSKTRFVDQAGTSVERDFVEAPSQMFEWWAYAGQTLSRFPQYCQTGCPAVDEGLLKRLNLARRYGRGLFYSRQLLYARYDMALYGDQVPDVMALWEQMEKETPLGHTPGTLFPGQFSHTMSGYAAGYYGYLWAEVLALDMLSRFEGNLMNADVGRRYRSTVLQRGGEATASELVRAFLNREPDNKAFYQEITGKLPR